MHPSRPQTLLYTRYGRRHVVFSLHPMPCWIVLQRHRSACLCAVKDAVSKLDVVLVLLATVTQSMNRYTKRKESPCCNCYRRITLDAESSKRISCPLRLKFLKQRMAPVSCRSVRTGRGLFVYSQTYSQNVRNSAHKDS